MPEDFPEIHEDIYVSTLTMSFFRSPPPPFSKIYENATTTKKKKMLRFGEIVKRPLTL